MKSGVFFGALFLGLVMAWAADPTGTISGSVTDPSGAPVAAAKVVATNLANGLSRETTSASDGGFVFPLIPVGTYNVSVQVAGFRRFEQRGISIVTDASVSLPVALQVGDVAETVTVEASATQVETRSGSLGQVVNQQKIVELPLNGRN